MNTDLITGTNADAPQNAEPSGDLQGEGNYDAARRYRKALGRFIADDRVESAAANAVPASQAEADELARAEQAGRQHSRGEDDDT
jgi:hypothetical protein